MKLNNLFLFLFSNCFLYHFSGYYIHYKLVRIKGLCGKWLIMWVVTGLPVTGPYRVCGVVAYSGLQVGTGVV